MKTAIYLRVSTNRQTQAQTIEQQLERLRKHLDLQGEALLADNIFRDDGYSGANLNRPGLDRLRDRVKGGVLDRVLLTVQIGWRATTCIRCCWWKNGNAAAVGWNSWTAR